jgi:hypothetical protein
MEITSVRCPVLGAEVTRILDFEGHVTAVICEEYDPAGGTCRLKAAALRGGPLTQLLERMSEHTLDGRGVACSMGSAYAPVAPNG